eukprot:CAMPEP_0197182260 /NCGR_PEP_ID=MMETSP1423-20130617/6275_1 /TAXON_ID=476441 /ORGANISM="Pseudo-nitzschia heimii, Strain UNC1101" /LENGTH=1020 /DNA_ID=CAMNT_0042632655 /DNA_START=253 /DNA_END=3316 /DNA_ORIENTATION=+
MALYSGSNHVAAAVIIPFLLIFSWSTATATRATTGSNSKLHRRQQRSGSTGYDKLASYGRGKSLRTRKLVRGQSWVEHSQRGPEVENVFVHRMNATADGCTCVRQVGLATGLAAGLEDGSADGSADGSTDGSADESADGSLDETPAKTPTEAPAEAPGETTCKCDNSQLTKLTLPPIQPVNKNPTIAPSVSGKGTSYYGSKSSYYGKGLKGSKGKGGGSYDDDGYYRYSKQEKSSKKSSKKDYGKGYGKGHGKGYVFDDDYTFPTPLPSRASPLVPSLAPTKVPTPTAAPQTIAPTPKKTAAPQTKAPTPPKTAAPQTKVPTPTAKNPTAKPPPPKPPPPKPPDSKCRINGDGLYGQDIGLATEFRFLYQAKVIPSVTDEEMTNDIIPKVEMKMGNDLLKYFFPNECNELTTRNIENAKLKGYAFHGNRERNRKRRQLQSPLSLNGLSIKPLDKLVEDGECDAAIMNDGFPCFLVQGSLTVFSTSKLDTTAIFQLENGITLIVDGNLNEADNRLLKISFKEFDEGGPIDVTNIGDSKPKNWFFDTAWWILVLIALGGVFVLVLLLVCCSRCFRRRRMRQPRPKQPAQRPNGAQVAAEKGQKNSSDSQKRSSSGRSSSSSSRKKKRSGSSDSNSSISTNESERRGGSAGSIPGSSIGVMDDDPNKSEYHFQSADQINQSLIPDRAEPIVEERMEDFSTGEILTKPSVSNEYDSGPLYKPMQMDSFTKPTSTYDKPPLSYTEVTINDDYNGVSYEDRIYQNNQVSAYNPTANQYGSNGHEDDLGSQPSQSNSLEQEQYGSSGGAESSDGRSRSLSQNKKEFRRVSNSNQPTPSPRHKISDNSTPVSHYSSDIHSATSRQMSYQGDNAIDDEENSYDDVSEYEIEYASQSERPSERMNDEMMEQDDMLEHSQYLEHTEGLYDEEEWVDENNHLASNSHSNSTPFSSNTNSNNHNNNSNTNSTGGTGGSASFSGSSGSPEDENLTPLPYLAHSAQLQQQHGQKTSFEACGANGSNPIPSGQLGH